MLVALYREQRALWFTVGLSMVSLGVAGIETRVAGKALAAAPHSSDPSFEIRSAAALYKTTKLTFVGEPTMKSATAADVVVRDATGVECTVLITKLPLHVDSGDVWIPAFEKCIGSAAPGSSSEK